MKGIEVAAEIITLVLGLLVGAVFFSLLFWVGLDRLVQVPVVALWAVSVIQLAAIIFAIATGRSDLVKCGIAVIVAFWLVLHLPYILLGAVWALMLWT